MKCVWLSLLLIGAIATSMLLTQESRSNPGGNSGQNMAHGKGNSIGHDINAAYDAAVAQALMHATTDSSNPQSNTSLIATCNSMSGTFSTTNQWVMTPKSAAEACRGNSTEGYVCDVTVRKATLCCFSSGDSINDCGGATADAGDDGTSGGAASTDDGGATTDAGDGGTSGGAATDDGGATTDAGAAIDA